MLAFVSPITPQPEDVFTPRAVVSPEMFTKRNGPDLKGNPGLQDVLREALRDKGGQVLLYGDTGVGKSSLLTYAARDEKISLVTVECMSDQTLETLIGRAIEQLIEVREIKRTKSRAVSTETEAQGGVPHFLTIRGRIRGDKGSTREFEVIEKAPIEVLLDAMQKTGNRLLVLDNFQNVTARDVRLHVAQTLELLSGRARVTGDIKMVVIGIADDAQSLLGPSPSSGRRTAEVGVPRMPDDEITEVLETGFGLLGLNVPAETVNSLVFLSDGFPYFCHMLGLHLARSANRADGRVTGQTLEATLHRVAQEVQESFRQRVDLAVEKGGRVQPRRRVLSIMASSTEREWRATAIQEAYAARYGKRDDYAFLQGALGALIKPKHGEVLRRTGTRGNYVYRFRDPPMRPYLRVTGFADH
jgi:hypothetical protein